MPVDTKSKQYESREADWDMIGDIMEGETAIKDAGTIYLPKLSGQTTVEYSAYKNRATFFNAYDRTVKGLTGAVMRRDPVVEVPAIVEPLLKNCTLSGLSFNDVTRMVVRDIIAYGYYGILVDMPEEESVRPYMALYSASNILNYRIIKQGDQDKLTLLVLQEEESIPDVGDKFETDTKKQIRVLSLEEGYLVVEVYQLVKEGSDEWGLVQIAPGVTRVEPQIKGNRLDYIPFTFFGAVNNEPEPSKPPLIDLANLNIKHWQVNADYYHGLHWCALPTPYFFGVEDKGKKFTIGPSKAIVSGNPNAKAGILEFSGQGLGSVEKALDRLEDHMAVMGARLLEHKKKGVESAEALQTRSADETATLITIVGSAENGMTNVLVDMSKWMGNEGEEVKLELNKDFISSRLSAQDITTLLGAVQAGKISQDTFLWNLKMGEILPKDRTIDDEKDLIEAEGVEPFTGEEEE